MNRELIEPFLNSAREITRQMTKLNISWAEESFEEENEVFINGVVSIITFAGKIKGRFLLGIDADTALDMARDITGESVESLKDQMALAVISEMNNIIAGDAITFLNNKLNLGLRLAPPVVMSGKDLIIAIPKLKSYSTKGYVGSGNITVNIAFEGGV